MSETFTDSSGLVLTVHARSECLGTTCVIHNPSPHHMRAMPLCWRTDRGIFERICPHGVGHPDPDSAAYLRALGQEVENVHGCDGCCRLTVLVAAPDGGREYTRRAR